MTGRIAFIGFGEAGQTISRGLAGYMIERVVSHGKRRAAEMREVSETLRSIGMEPTMAAAAAARQQWVASLGLKTKSEDRVVLVKAIREAMGK